jgi:hypothetical protein
MTHSLASNPVDACVTGDTEQPGSYVGWRRPSATRCSKGCGKCLSGAVLCGGGITEQCEAKSVDGIDMLAIDPFEVNRESTGAVLPGSAIRLGLGEIERHMSG